MVPGKHDGHHAAQELPPPVEQVTARDFELQSWFIRLLDSALNKARILGTTERTSNLL